MISPHLLFIDASYSYRTYLGCLEGIPSPQACKDMALREANKMWGERATFLIEPDIKGDHMPKWTHMVWTSGPAKDKENNDGSELCIIWFSEMGPDTDRVLNVIDWEKYSQDYQV
jgi:hypothetical protein